MKRTCPNCQKEALVLLCKECDYESDVLLDKKPLVIHTHAACEGCRAMHADSKTKDEAIRFAEKYLFDRKRKGTDETNPDDPFWTWKIATEYVLKDIIPHLYGEALD